MGQLLNIHLALFSFHFMLYAVSEDDQLHMGICSENDDP